MQSIKGMGKLLLSAYIMRRINSRIARGSGGILSKYAKLMLVGYLFKKFKVKNIAVSKLEEAIEPVEKVESKEKARGSAIAVIGKVIVVALAGVAIIFAVKKLATKYNWHKMQVQ